jgi:hypothetical protein
MSANRLRAGLVVMALLLSTSCGSSALSPSDGFVALGTWGGDNTGMIVTDSAAHVHVGCTFGDMPGRIPFDASGHFTVDGNYVLQAYPIQIGPSLPASFSGQVVGRTLTLAIAVNDTVAKKVVALGPVTVVFGREPQMGPCPICRAPRRWR